MNCSTNIPIQDLTKEVEEEVAEADKVDAAVEKRREVLRRKELLEQLKLIWREEEVVMEEIRGMVSPRYMQMSMHCKKNLLPTAKITCKSGNF